MQLSDAVFIFAGIGMSLLIVLIGAAFSGGRQHKTRKRRAASFARYGSKNGAGSVNETTVRRTRPQEKAWLAWLIARLPRREKLLERIEQTGRSISISTLILFAILVTLGAAALLHFTLGFSGLIAVVLSPAIGIGSVSMMLNTLAAKRSAKFTADFPDAIDLMVRGLKSGLPTGETIASISREFSGPVGEEFKRITEAVRFGTTLDEALWQASRRLSTPELRFFAITLSIQQETGGNLAETLANLSDILRRRRAMKLKIRALSSEARASAYILGSLPFVMFALLFFINHDYVMMLFNDPRGTTALGVGGALLGTGAATMFKMVRFKI